MVKDLLLLILLVTIGDGRIAGKGSAMQKLKDDLLKDYDKFVRPVKNYRNVTIMKIGFSPIKLVKVDEQENEMVLDGWLKLLWNDESFVWNSQEYDGIKVINMPINDIWQPDLTPYNGKRSATDKQQGAYALVYNSGDVMWVPSGRFTTNCNLTYSQNSKNIQMCNIKLGSWTYSGTALDLQLGNASLSDLSNYNPFWEITKLTAERHVKYYNCCVDPYPDISFNLTLRQRVSASHCLSKTLRISSNILFLSMFFLPLQQKMLMGCIAIISCAVYAALTIWTGPIVILASFAVTPVAVNFAVGLAAIIVEIVIINIGQRRKSKAPMFMKLFSTSLNKTLPFLRESKTATTNSPSNGIVDPINEKSQEIVTNSCSCKEDSCVEVTTICDLIMFVLFGITFIVVGNYF